MLKERNDVVFALAVLVAVAFAGGIGVAMFSGRVAAESTGSAPPAATAAAPAAGMEGWIDGVVGPPVVGGKVVVGGWAADRVAGAPVSKVDILLDGKTVGAATLGVERKDVAKAVGRDTYVKAGWNAVVDLAGVTPGAHQISAIAYDSKGARQPLRGDQTIDVKPAS